MSDQTSDKQAEKRHIGGELVIPVAALLFTGYYFYTIIDVPRSAQISAFFVGSVLSLCIVIFIIRSVLMIRRGDADLGFSTLIAPRNYVAKRLILLALTIAYIFLIQWGGFTLTSFFFLSGAMLVLGGGKRKGLIFGLSAVLSFGGWLLFVVAFETRFPEGPFENLMKGLF